MSFVIVREPIKDKYGNTLYFVDSKGDIWRWNEKEKIYTKEKNFDN